MAELVVNQKELQAIRANLKNAINELTNAQENFVNWTAEACVGWSDEAKDVFFENSKIVNSKMKVVIEDLKFDKNAYEQAMSKYVQVEAISEKAVRKLGNIDQVFA